ncbi:MAG: hypothetical protein ABSC05_16455 [Candidatus Solibacter sp.]|jgi:hypothetical protein
MVTEQFAATAAAFQPSVVLVLVVADALNPPGTPGTVEQAPTPLGFTGCHSAGVTDGSHPISEVCDWRQPSIGIHLASAYPCDLSGRLTLAFTPDSLVDDPAVEFLNGQRYVDFTVPGGATDAVFGTTATGVVMQTGSSAGAIALSASFSLGGYVVTGSSPVTQNITIPASAPEILAFQIGAMDSASFELLITGVSTTRSLTQFAFTLIPTGNSTLVTTTLTADVSAAFNGWFNSAASRSFGGQFTVSVLFNVAGDITAIQGITATATNGIGTSAPMSLALQSSGGQ